MIERVETGIETIDFYSGIEYTKNIYRVFETKDEAIQYLKNNNWININD